jgi:hypothetical protein
MADKAALVDQIKSIQRADPDSKQAWWDYCDQNLGGVKDPNRHDAAVLGEFVNAYHGGQVAPAAAAPRGGAAAPRGGCGGYSRPPPLRRPAAVSPVVGGWSYPQQPSWGGKGGGYGPPPVHAVAWGGASAGGGLADYIKTGQRQSQHWKVAWQSYCKLYGTGFNDPAKYDEPFIIGFIDYAAQLVVQDLQNVAAEQGISLDDPAPAVGMKRPMGGMPAGQPPAKRAMPAGASGFDEKAELVDKVKALQRTDPDTKQAWWTFCDEQMGGVKDPNRHEAATLQQFLDNYA